MKKVLLAGFCAISLSIIGCAADGNDEGAAGSESDVVSQLGENEVMTCGDTEALVGGKDGKATLVTLTKTAALYELSGKTDKLATLQTSLAGTTCTKVTGANAAPWAAASGLLAYADEIDGLASTVTDEMASIENDSNRSNNASANRSATKHYAIFAFETAKRGTLELGTTGNNSAGELTNEDDAEGLDDQDWSYGGIGACYALGGGEDYGEWFQGASDGIYLSADVLPRLNGTHASYSAHENVKALDGLSDGTNAIELSVGAWSFLIPDGFSK